MGFFDTIDSGLHHGGATALDVAGFIPGLNIGTEALQTAYHAAHAVSDAWDGNTDKAWEEGGSALWHGALTGLNLLTLGAGGELAEGANAATSVVEGATESANVVEGAAQGAGAIGEAAEGGASVIGDIAERAGEGLLGEEGILSTIYEHTDIPELIEYAERGTPQALAAVSSISGHALDLGVDAVANGMNIGHHGEDDVEIPGIGELFGGAVHQLGEAGHRTFGPAEHEAAPFIDSPYAPTIANVHYDAGDAVCR